ncbi:MAG TPA: LPS assembly protein LptD [Steroidobacteraceae bacterium]
MALAPPVSGQDAPCPDSSPAADDEPQSPTPQAPSVDSASQPITIEADDDDFEFDVNGNARLCGNVEMRQGERVIRTDCLVYDAEAGRARLDGGVEYSDGKLRVRGGNGNYSAATGAQIDGAEFELLERSARGSATSLHVDGQDTITLEGVSFTTCPAEDVDWELRAGRIELDTRTRNGTSRGTTVRFKQVPIFYMPYMSFPLGPQRKSGFLFPEPGYSSRNGAEIPVPYYWNLRSNVDLLTEPTWYAKRGIDLGGKLRYLTTSQRGELDFNYLPHDDVLGIDRHFAHLAHVAELPGEWRFRIDATDVGDDAYFEDFALGPEGTSVPFTERLAQASYRDEHWNVRAQLQHFQTIDEELIDELRPYARTPRVLASGDWDVGLGAIEYGFDAEFVNFDRNVGVTGWRMDVAPRVGFDWSAPGFFVRPSAGFRYTQYSLDHTPAGVEESPTRSLPFASIDAGLVFERSSGSRGQRRMTLEPRALYLYTPYREQNDLPLFDTGLPDLNLVQLYRINRYVGADRVNDANQMAFGLTSRLFDATSGTQYVALSVGQTYYFERPRVVLPTETPSTRDTSDFVAQLSLTAWKNWNIDAGIQWNPEDTRSERSQLRLQYRPGGERVVNLAYRAQRERLEQVDVSAAWPIGKHWNAFGRVVHSLRDDSTLERFAGFEYSSCCWRVRAVARRFISNSQGTQETGFQLQLELIGMASVGNDANAFLERSIRGYSPEISRR